MQSLSWPEFGREFAKALLHSWREFCEENRLDPHDGSNFAMWVQKIALTTELRPGQPIHITVGVRARAGKTSTEYFYMVDRNEDQLRLFRT